MIFTFTGKTGSGKTYNMVKTARKYWLQGFDIYSNTILFFTKNLTNKRISIETMPSMFTIYERIFYLCHKSLFKLFGTTIKPYERGKIIYFQEIQEILEVTDGIILFDEAQVLFNARLWEGLPAEFQYKLQQHRKHNLHLFCTTQSMGTIDITYRRLVQFWYHHETRFSFGNFFQIFIQYEKDINCLYNKIDDLMTPNLSQKYFFIHYFSPRYYDTLFDIGFRRFKTIWLMQLNNKNQFTNQFRIIPKNMSLSDAQRVSSLLTSTLNPNKFKNFKKR